MRNTAVEFVMVSGIIGLESERGNGNIVNEIIEQWSIIDEALKC